MKRFAIMATLVVILSLGTTATANAQRFRGGGGFTPPSHMVAGRPMTMGSVRGFPQASSFVFPRSSFVTPRNSFVAPHFNTFNGLVTPRMSTFNGFNSLNRFNTLNGFNSFNRFGTFNNSLGLGMGLGLGFGGFGSFGMFNSGLSTGISPLGGGFVVPFNSRSSFIP